MPRKSPFLLNLTIAQHQELGVRARRYTLLYRDVIRAKIVLLAASGMDNDEIAAPPRHPSGGRLEMAKTLLRARSRRARRASVGGRSAAFPP